ncbi:MAG: hypothetical protein JWN98_1789 [Abditibacteriota bacterium]|nr:hypothetical protein [Abditibacteriota bacterium]
MVNKTARCLAYGIAMGALAFAPAVKAQDSTTSAGMSATGSMDSSAMMQPMQVTGQVLRYYVDRSGYVTAMDVQTANGVQMVRFAPGMGQRIYSTYPVGGQASVWVSGSPGSMGSTNYHVIGLGDRQPAAGFMSPSLVSDTELLQAEPYILIGTKMAQFSGRLRSVVTDNTGEVLGIILDGVDSNALMAGGMTNASMSTDSMGGMMGGTTGGVLVRVPREMRHPNEGAMGGSSRATPLFPGAIVEVVGYPEAPRYGVLSNVSQRVAASALVVNGRAVGAVGMPKMSSETTRTLLNLNIGPSATDEERRAGQMGYSTYDPTGGANSMSGTSPNTSGANTGTQ